ncbi:MAG: hypothetical protein COB30_019710 [Ectothiorhodospiraceae bacterium]|nr:hypothetical protein [Ectothiorhodospiraceae bacterium]
MGFSIKKLFLLSGFFLFSSLLYILPTQAHEPRLIGNGAINVVVGWRAEPVFKKNINRFDFIVTDEVEVGTIDLDVYVLFLDQDSADAKVISSAKLTDELRRDRDNPNRFNKYFLPTKDGAYGFHIIGMVDGIAIDEIFICRGGTQNVDNRSFGCVEELQKFPNGSKKDRDSRINRVDRDDDD